MSNFIQGFFYPLKSIKLFTRHPKLIVYSIVPMIINLIIYGTIFFYTYKWLSGKANDSLSFTGSNQILFDIIQTFLKIFVFLLILIVCYFLFVIFGGIVSAPFNEKISKHVEEKEFGIKIDSQLTFLKDAVMSIRAELKKLLFYFSIMIPFFLINFIPMIGSVVSFTGGLLFSFFYNALDYLDYPLTRRKIPFRKKLTIVNSKRMMSYGFGAMAFLMTFLPVINALMKPLLVASGTSFFYEKKFLIEDHSDININTTV